MPCSKHRPSCNRLSHPLLLPTVTSQAEVKDRYSTQWTQRQLQCLIQPFIMQISKRLRTKYHYGLNGWIVKFVRQYTLRWNEIHGAYSFCNVKRCSVGLRNSRLLRHTNDYDRLLQDTTRSPVSQVNISHSVAYVICVFLWTHPIFTSSSLRSI
jgi:hypothetical protein